MLSTYTPAICLFNLGFLIPEQTRLVELGDNSIISSIERLDNSSFISLSESESDSKRFLVGGIPNSSFVRGKVDKSPVE